jgi:hypothetical protein
MPFELDIQTRASLFSELRESVSISSLTASLVPITGRLEAMP